MQDIKESIRAILFTAPGERATRPGFGCGVRDLLFAPLNADTRRLIESDVRAALLRFEPRIEPVRIDVSMENTAVGQLTVSIDYRVRETNHMECFAFRV